MRLFSCGAELLCAVGRSREQSRCLWACYIDLETLLRWQWCVKLGKVCQDPSAEAKGFTAGVIENKQHPGNKKKGEGERERGGGR